MEPEVALWLKYKEVPKGVIEDITIAYYFEKTRQWRQAETNFRYVKCIVDFDRALKSISKTKKKNIVKKYIINSCEQHYNKLRRTKEFWEVFPSLTGEWLQDKKYFCKLTLQIEMDKEYIKKILDSGNNF